MRRDKQRSNANTSSNWPVLSVLKMERTSASAEITTLGRATGSESEYKRQTVQLAFQCNSQSPALVQLVNKCDEPPHRVDVIQRKAGDVGDEHGVEVFGEGNVVCRACAQ